MWNNTTASNCCLNQHIWYLFTNVATKDLWILCFTNCWIYKKSPKLTKDTKNKMVNHLISYIDSSTNFICWQLNQTLWMQCKARGTYFISSKNSFSLEAIRQLIFRGQFNIPWYTTFNIHQLNDKNKFKYLRPENQGFINFIRS